jgi:hypothetical protein
VVFGNFGHIFMSNIDAMKLKPRFSRKQIGIQGHFVAGTKVRPLTVDGQSKNLSIE